EHDFDFPGENHGDSGKIGIRRIFPNDWDALSTAASRAFETVGHSYLADQNGDFGDGYFPLAQNTVDDVRVTAATTYLDQQTRSPPNVARLTEPQASRLLFDGRRCIGVRVSEKDKERDVRAGQVIVSAGALNSPAILMRAGIGPAQHLMEVGVDVIVNRPGV